MTRRNACVLTALTLSALASLGAVAGVAWESFGAGRDDQYGRGVGLIGDINSDGVEDFMVGAVGVSGDSPQVDEAIAIAGLNAISKDK